jgi:protein-tyrosine phosphatase
MSLYAAQKLLYHLNREPAVQARFKAEKAALLDDYELSAEHYTEGQMAKVRLKLGDSGVDVEGYRAVFGAPRYAMATFLATLRERYGSVEAYLEDRGGVSPQVFAELRALLVHR